MSANPRPSAIPRDQMTDRDVLIGIWLTLAALAKELTGKFPLVTFLLESGPVFSGTPACGGMVLGCGRMVTIEEFVGESKRLRQAVESQLELFAEDCPKTPPVDSTHSTTPSMQPTPGPFPAPAEHS